MCMCFWICYVNTLISSFNEFFGEKGFSNELTNSFGEFSIMFVLVVVAVG